MRMSSSEIPFERLSGEDEPNIVTKPPGPQSRTWLVRLQHRAAPMAAATPDPDAIVKAPVPAGSIVFATGYGSNVMDVDGNRYVDLAAGFGALLVGHCHRNITRAITLQAERLLLALGDVHSADAKVALLERLAELYPEPGARVVLAQSGSDAVTAALKTAVLHTQKTGVVAFEDAYHGLGYGALAGCGLRASYRAPFQAQLNPAVHFAPYPKSESDLKSTLSSVRAGLAQGNIGAVLVEPILGRGGCIVPPPRFLPELRALAHERGALLIADEIWTGLGRAGKSLFSTDAAFAPDIVCIGKGLGGGLPISACLGRRSIMDSWRQPDEVVHTSTFSGAPLACTAALALLDVAERQRLAERSARVGGHFLNELKGTLAGVPAVAEVRGAGLMIGIDLGNRANGAVRLQRALLERGYLTTTGGGRRQVLILTPPLTIDERLLHSFAIELRSTLSEMVA
jgi:4-aminobutyrate aminotransferase/(S)-3-amino-2-methylpropionate transaminase